MLKLGKKNSILMDPINRYQKWKKKHPRMEDEDDVATEINSTVRVGANEKSEILVLSLFFRLIVKPTI